MDHFWQNILIELGLFTLLGILYYFYQKRKLLQYEENKTPVVMGLILQSCILEKNEAPQSELDALIEALDDYLHNRSTTPPLVLLKHFKSSIHCSRELKDVIDSGLKEIESDSKE